MNNPALPTREQALALLHEWIQNPNLRRHCYAVEAAMRHHARLLAPTRSAGAWPASSTTSTGSVTPMPRGIRSRV